MLLGNLLLALAWTALMGELTLTNLVTGFVLGHLVVTLMAAGGVVSSAYGDRTRALFSLAGFLCREFLVANVRMAVDVVLPAGRMRPGIIRVPLDVRDDYQILALSTLINLTPGSLALDVSADRSVMYVHVMHVTTPDEARAHIKDHFEQRVLRVLG